MASRISTWLCCVVLWAAPAVGSAADAASVIAEGRDLYFTGRYEEALSAFDVAEALPNLTTEQRIEVYKYEAFILYLLKLHTEARGVWVELLTLRPDYSLDPVEASPELIAFFERIEVDVPPAIDAEEVRPPPATVDTRERGCGTVICLVPFGVGQFANGNAIKGTIFATSELAFLATNLVLYWTRKTEFDDTGGFADPEGARLSYTLQHVFLGLFAATAVAGIIDAYLFP